MVSNGFPKCSTTSLIILCWDWDFWDPKLDHYVYYKQVGGHFLVITIYVDVMLYFGNIKDVICDLKCYLLAQFDMKD
jgi:hypothetical protein